jgi:hypothetical protein
MTTPPTDRDILHLWHRWMYTSGVEQKRIALNAAMRATNLALGEDLGPVILTRICQNKACGKEFASLDRIIAKGGGKYCSKRCTAAGTHAARLATEVGQLNRKGNTL